MTQKERLVELLKKSPIDKCLDVSWNEYFSAFADYLLNNGVIVPPCKVGDMVYGIRPKVCRFGIRKNPFDCAECPYLCSTDKFGSFCKTDYEVYECIIPTVSWMFANVLESKTKRFFLTREEAEQALKERETK